jgi:hypothetical protein
VVQKLVTERRRLDEAALEDLRFFDFVDFATSGFFFFTTVAEVRAAVRRCTFFRLVTAALAASVNSMAQRTKTRNLTTVLKAIPHYSAVGFSRRPEKDKVRRLVGHDSVP